MKLVQPTDFNLLEAFDQYGRNVAANLAIRLDRDRGYINTRMPHLEDYHLIESIGPAANVGLYELTDRGKTVLEHREKYQSLGYDEFEALVDESIE